jgi:uncharacterized membrane protein
MKVNKENKYIAGPLKRGQVNLLQIVEMQNELRERNRRNIANMRMAKDITMAVLILGVAVILFLAPRLGLLEHVSDGFRIVLGCLFALYGSFRLYRGIKRDY